MEVSCKTFAKSVQFTEMKTVLMLHVSCLTINHLVIHILVPCKPLASVCKSVADVACLLLSNVWACNYVTDDNC